MVIIIPEGVYTMNDLMSIIKANAGRYRTVPRKAKSQMLTELTQTFMVFCSHYQQPNDNTDIKSTTFL